MSQVDVQTSDHSMWTQLLSRVSVPLPRLPDQLSTVQEFPHTG